MINVTRLLTKCNGLKPWSCARTALETIGILCKLGGGDMVLCPVIVVLVFVVLDIVTGLAKAFATSGFDSSIMREGFFHKLGEVLTVVLAYAVDYGLPQVGVPLDVHVSGLCCVYLALMEVGSIIENIGTINPDLVGPLGKIFAKLRGDNNDLE